MGLKDVLNQRLFGASLDGADGALYAKRLAVVVAVSLAVGAAAIFFVQRYVSGIDTWEATVTGVGKGTVNFTFDEESGDCDVASCPAGMPVEEGDRVLVRIDEDEGNLVVKVLDE